MWEPYCYHPPHILSTSARPDLVLTKPTKRSMVLIELTIPFNSCNSIYAAHQRKTEKPNYQHLQLDLESLGWRLSFIAIEIGSLGHYLPAVVSQLCKSDQTFNDKKRDTRLLLDSIAKAVIGCSQTIFYARKNSNWLDGEWPEHVWGEGVVWVSLGSDRGGRICSCDLRVVT